jgi:hypothetical protein
MFSPGKEAKVFRKTLEWKVSRASFNNTYQNQLHFASQLYNPWAKY